MFKSASTLPRRCGTLLLIATLVLITVFTINLPAIHAATTLTVTTTADDAAGRFTCGTICTLRDALDSAANGDTIQFQNGLTGEIVLTPRNTLLIATSVTINGPGADKLAIDGNNTTTVFTIRNNSTVSISGLTIQHGNGTIFGGDGGGIYNEGTGTLTVSNSTISGNSAPGHDGGGIASSGPLIISNSTVSGNSAYYGGGIDFYGGDMLISNSTISGNSATWANGGAIFDAYGNVTISNSTLSSNSANKGGGLSNFGGAFYLVSNIIANNWASVGPDVYSQSSNLSLGYNLIGDGTNSGITAANGDQIGTGANPINPKLNLLTNNGGLTQTMTLFAGSPAIGNGNCAGNSSVTPNVPAVTIDQRGIARGTPCDVGAYEGSTSPAIDTIGIFRSGVFYLRLHNTTGFADITVAFNPAGTNLPVVGDWTGAGYDTVGVFDSNTATFTLCTANVTAVCANTANQLTFTLGNPNDTPLAGRWLSGAAHSGAGVYRPGNGVLYLENALTTSFADDAMVMGLPGDVGIAGNWTGKSFDSPGVFRPGALTFYLSNQVTSGAVYADTYLVYGSATDLPIAGDWIAQGHDGIGMFRPTDGYVYLKNVLATGFADNNFSYGLAGDLPFAGHWQAVYPPAPPAGILIATPPIPVPNSGSGIVPGENQIGG